MPHEFFKRNTPEQRSHPASSQEIGGTAVRYASEHSHSIEDREKYQALEVLRELGVLIPLKDVDTYHGRAGSNGESEPWKVDPQFKNGGNDSGNRNVFGAPLLYTADQKTAADFARARAFREYHAKGGGDLVAYFAMPDNEKKEYLKKVYEDVEVYDITSLDTDATILSNTFSFQALSEQNQARYHINMRKLLMSVPLTEAASFGMDANVDSHTIQSAIKQLSSIPGIFKSESNLARVSSVTGMNPGDVRTLTSAYNARNYIWQSPSRAASLIENTPSGIITQTDEKGASFPVSLDYIARFMKESHIVGRESKADSATLGRVITLVSLFNLQKVNPIEQYELERERVSKGLMPIAQSLEARLPRFDSNRSSLFDVLDDVHVRPAKLVESAKNQPGFKKVFGADLGNWEGYTLEEHTETVLRNFDENFMENIPAELVAPMRLAILTHDIGKPIAASKGELHRQTAYNKAVADRFFQTIGVDPTLGDFLKTMTTQGMSLAAEAAVFGRDQYLPELRRLGAMELRKIAGNITEEMVDGYLEMCEMLVTCDGGAYTRMAVTRKKDGIYRNHKSFDSSFVEPAGPGRRDLRLKNAGIAQRSRF